MHKDLDSIPAPYRQEMVHTYKPSTLEVETRGSEVTLRYVGYMRSISENKTGKKEMVIYSYNHSTQDLFKEAQATQFQGSLDCTVRLHLKKIKKGAGDLAQW